ENERRKKRGWGRFQKIPLSPPFVKGEIMRRNLKGGRMRGGKRGAGGDFKKSPSIPLLKRGKL
ncbi:MAG TPA: hypothetical protein PLW07_05730, partial [bacterium]|nr:hypothetical protein [bacterium]